MILRGEKGLKSIGKHMIWLGNEMRKNWLGIDNSEIMCVWCKELGVGNGW